MALRPSIGSPSPPPPRFVVSDRFPDCQPRSQCAGPAGSRMRFSASSAPPSPSPLDPQQPVVLPRHTGCGPCLVSEQDPRDDEGSPPEPQTQRASLAIDLMPRQNLA